MSIKPERINSLLLESLKPKVCDYLVEGKFNEEDHKTLRTSIVRFNLAKGNKEILIYPNPSTQFIRIEKQNEPFKIYELATSRLVLKGLIRSNQIDVTSLSPGHFYLQVGRSRIKFTKQK